MHPPHNIILFSPILIFPNVCFGDSQGYTSRFQSKFDIGTWRHTRLTVTKKKAWLHRALNIIRYPGTNPGEWVIVLVEIANCSALRNAWYRCV